MIRMLNPATVAPPASAYSHGVLLPAGADTIVTSGTLGFAPDGTLPADFEAQCRNVFANTAKILGEAGMTLADIVKISAYLTKREDIASLRVIRDEHLPHRPASTVIISQLINPAWLLEMEVIAARAPR